MYWHSSHQFGTKRRCQCANTESFESNQGIATQIVALQASTGSLGASFSIGDRIQTTAALNVRATPSTTGTLLGTQVSGALGTIAGGPTTANGYVWWNITYDATHSGWSVQDYLKVNPIPTLTISANPTSGQTPLAVYFRYSDYTGGRSYTINFGDGNSGVHTCRLPPCSLTNPHCQFYDVSHTYTQAGTYTATLTQNGLPPCLRIVSCQPPVLGTVVITVTATVDTTPPTTPTNLAGTALSTSQINLTWTASNDNVAVTGYKIFRNGVQVGTGAPTATATPDSLQAPSTPTRYLHTMRRGIIRRSHRVSR